MAEKRCVWLPGTRAHWRSPKAPPPAPHSITPTPRPVVLQACRLHPILKALCIQDGIESDYLQRCVKEFDLGWVCGRVPTRPAFTQAEK